MQVERSVKCSRSGVKGSDSHWKSTYCILSLRTFSTPVSISACVHICECCMMEVYILTVWWRVSLVVVTIVIAHIITVTD